MHITGLTTTQVSHLRSGGGDAFGNPPEQARSSGSGTPCRHCLRIIPKDAPYLIFAHKPFKATHAYTEIGPIFLCRDTCAAPDGTNPDVFRASPQYLMKAYSAEERIIFGTGAIIDQPDVPDYAKTLLSRDEVSFVDVRSAKNNCWLARITRD